jgi:hypothetical protein
MSDIGNTAGLSLGTATADEDGEPWSLGYEWVKTCSVDDFVNRMRAIREGEKPAAEGREKPQPATAIRVLNAFALHRPIDQLVESAESFDYRDAVSMLATAALRRPVGHAAELAIKQWDRESAAKGARETPLTDGIIHDVACQRTAVDVAEFVRVCSRKHKTELVDKTMRVFTRTSSGRTNLDKALLYIALRDVQCGAEAAALLRQTLESIDKQGSAEGADTDPEELHDLVEALRHLSPSERILEEWIDEQLRVPKLVPRTRQLVAWLIDSRRDGRDTLVEHVGQRWSRYNLVEVCRQLAGKSPEKCAVIRWHAASRGNAQELAEIVADWHGTEALTKTTRDLLADIVAQGPTPGSGPRSLEDLDYLDLALDNILAPSQCRRLLRIAAAVHTEGRSGADLVALLRRVEQPRDRHRAAQTIAQRLTVRVLRGDAAADLFAEYVVRARGSGGVPEAVYVACKELADPSTPGGAREGSGTVIAEIAARLYVEGLDRDGWDLLERCLENEQFITPEEVALIVARLHRAGRMNAEDRHLLLRATVGRWSDVRRREQAVGELRRGGFDAEALQVIRSLR